MINHQKLDGWKGFYKSSWWQSKANLQQTYFNFLNVALLSKWCHLITLWMLIMIKRVFWSYHSVEKKIECFSKGPFLSHFLYFSILLQIIHTMSKSIVSCCFWYRGLWERLIPQCHHISVLKACVRYFLSNFQFFHQMIAL